MPRTGGDYVYLYEAYGPLPAFLSGWVSFLIGFAGPGAASAFASAKYLLTPLQGPVAAIGRPLTAGGEMYFDWLNAERGGIAGRYKVKLVEEDTGYDAATAVAKYQKLKDGVEPDYDAFWFCAQPPSAVSSPYTQSWGRIAGI